MARYTQAQVQEMLQRAGYKHIATTKDVAAANRFGEKVFARTRDKIFNAPPPTTPDTASQPVQSYEDWLKGAGSPYANSYSPDYLNQEYDPYFNQQSGGLDYEKQLAQDQLGRNTDQTMQNTNENFNNRGLYGSGIYQNELNKSLENLNRGFNDNYGTGQYTPFSQRKAEIEQQRMISKDSASLSRQGQAFNAYRTQFYPLLSGQ